MKYRRKPLVVEAWRWTFAEGGEQPPAWITGALNKWPGEGGIAFWPDGDKTIVDPNNPWGRKAHIAIKTKEGIMRALPGDWIINGLPCGLLPCKPDIFEGIYEPVKEQEDPEPPASPPPWGSL